MNEDCYETICEIATKAAIDAVVELGFVDNREATKALVLALLDQIEIGGVTYCEIESLLRDA